VFLAPRFSLGFGKTLPLNGFVLVVVGIGANPGFNTSTTHHQNPNY